MSSSIFNFFVVKSNLHDLPLSINNFLQQTSNIVHFAANVSLGVNILSSFYVTLSGWCSGEFTLCCMVRWVRSKTACNI